MGRPKLLVDINVAQGLYDNGFSLREIAVKLNSKTATLWRRLQEAGVATKKPLFAYRERLRTYPIDDTIFENIDTQEKAYILGFLYADGYVNKNISQVSLKLQRRDEPILNKIKLCLNYNKPLNYSVARGKFEQCNLIICNKKIYYDLQSHGLHPCKSFTCEFPVLRDDLNRHFIRGYFDGNGCICVRHDKRHGTLVASFRILASSMLCNSFKNHFLKQGIASYIGHDKRVKTGVDYIETRRIDSIYKMYSYLYEGSSICLDRKHDKFLYFIKNKKHDLCVNVKVN